MKTLALERDVDELLRRIGQVRPDSPRKWGRMSAHQMICHLTDAFRMATGEKAVTGSPTLRDRTLIKWIALHLPLAWPEGTIRTVPEVDQEVGGTAPTEFARDVAELETRLRSFTTRRGAERPTHPIFGRLSEPQWLRWGYLHVDHHLRQFGF
jgi:hypothetical protein